jgi:hypothetical protein
MRRIRGFEDILGIRDKNPAIATIARTKMAWNIIHNTNVLLPSNNNNSSRLCADSGIAPKIAMSTAPVETSIVPPKDQRVKGSPRIKVAHIELKTNPDACNVDKTGNGSVVICIVLPTRLDIMNMLIPSCQRRRR